MAVPRKDKGKYQWFRNGIFYLIRVMEEVTTLIVSFPFLHCLLEMHVRVYRLNAYIN
jgi:hypothetical protein